MGGIRYNVVYVYKKQLKYFFWHSKMQVFEQMKLLPFLSHQSSVFLHDILSLIS